MSEPSAEEQILVQALHDTTCRLPEHVADPRCRLSYWARVAHVAIAALDLPARDERIRAAVAEEIADELNRRAEEFEPGPAHGLLKSAMRIAHEHGRTDREEQE